MEACLKITCFADSNQQVLKSRKALQTNLINPIKSWEQEYMQGH